MLKKLQIISLNLIDAVTSFTNTIAAVIKLHIIFWVSMILYEVVEVDLFIVQQNKKKTYIYIKKANTYKLDLS